MSRKACVCLFIETGSRFPTQNNSSAMLLHCVWNRSKGNLIFYLAEIGFWRKEQTMRLDFCWMRGLDWFSENVLWVGSLPGILLWAEKSHFLSRGLDCGPYLPRPPEVRWRKSSWSPMEKDRLHFWNSLSGILSLGYCSCWFIFPLSWLPFFFLANVNISDSFQREICKPICSLFRSGYSPHLLGIDASLAIIWWRKPCWSRMG